MKIAVYGATGQVGSQIVAEAARRGHEVLALSRHEPGTALPASSSWQQGDVTDTAAVAGLAQRFDVVVAAFGPSREPGGDPSAYPATVLALAGAVRKTRLAVVGGAGSLLDAEDRPLVADAHFPESYRPEAQAQAAALHALRQLDPSCDWTYLSPAPEIGDGERTGGYRIGADHPVGSFVSFADYAVALIDELERPAHRRERFTVATR